MPESEELFYNAALLVQKAKDYVEKDFKDKMSRMPRNVSVLNRLFSMLILFTFQMSKLIAIEHSKEMAALRKSMIGIQVSENILPQCLTFTL